MRELQDFLNLCHEPDDCQEVICSSVNRLPTMEFKSSTKRKFKPYKHDKASYPTISTVPCLSVSNRDPKSVKQS